MRRESYGDAPVPMGVAVLTMGVDVQDDRLELIVIGWGPGEESWLVDRQLLPGDTSQPDPWQMLDEALGHEYRHASGISLPIRSTCIDSAGHRTTMVYDWAYRHRVRSVHATIGRDGQRPIVSTPSMQKWGMVTRPVALHTIGVDAAKALLTSRLGVTEAGPGYVHIPMADWSDEELAEQLTSERLFTRFVKGIPQQQWKKTRARNEMLDCAVLALAALRLVPRLDLKVEHERLTGVTQPPPVKPPTTKKPWITRRPGWVR
jgi:phage terminase large subunit GpA-like protein